MSQAAYAYKTDRLLSEFAEAVLDGLSEEPKRIPCRFLYDARGSELFEKITELEEYYPTRTEIKLLEQYAHEIAAIAGPGIALIEFGSGSSRKTRLLIDALENLAAYVPIDISDAALSDAEERLNGRYPRLAVLPVHADFNQPMDLPDQIARAPRLGFFPGSTIGNFSKNEACSFLIQAGKLLGSGSGLVIGADLKKDPSILVPAYDDAKGVTAEFNLNLLARINRELDGTFDLSTFAHKPFYNEEAGRIETYLESLEDQTISILDEEFVFNKGERIHTENSHKYSVEEFHELAVTAGWTPKHTWVDEDNLFSVHHLTQA